VNSDDGISDLIFFTISRITAGCKVTDGRRCPSEDSPWDALELFIESAFSPEEVPPGVLHHEWLVYQIIRSDMIPKEGVVKGKLLEGQVWNLHWISQMMSMFSTTWKQYVENLDIPAHLTHKEVITATWKTLFSLQSVLGLAVLKDFGRVDSQEILLTQIRELFSYSDGRLREYFKYYPNLDKYSFAMPSVSLDRGSNWELLRTTVNVSLDFSAIVITPDPFSVHATSCFAPIGYGANGKIHWGYLKMTGTRSYCENGTQVRKLTGKYTGYEKAQKKMDGKACFTTTKVLPNPGPYLPAKNLLTGAIKHLTSLLENTFPDVHDFRTDSSKNVAKELLTGGDRPHQRRSLQGIPEVVHSHGYTKKEVENVFSGKEIGTHSSSQEAAELFFSKMKIPRCSNCKNEAGDLLNGTCHICHIRQMKKPTLTEGEKNKLFFQYVLSTVRDTYGKKMNLTGFTISDATDMTLQHFFEMNKGGFESPLEIKSKELISESISKKAQLAMQKAKVDKEKEAKTSYASIDLDDEAAEAAEAAPAAPVSKTLASLGCNWADLAESDESGESDDEDED